MSYPPEVRVVVDKLKASVEITKEEENILQAYYERALQEDYEESCREDLAKAAEEEAREYRKYMNELVEWEDGVCVTRGFALSCVGDIY